MQIYEIRYRGIEREIEIQRNRPNVFKRITSFKKLYLQDTRTERYTEIDRDGDIEIKS